MSNPTDLSKLSRTEREELFRLLQEKALLQKEKVLETFKPHAGQRAFLESPARIRAMFSGNGFGKTTALTIDLIWTHTRTHPYRDTTSVSSSWLIVPGLDKAEDYVTELRRWCPPSFMPKLNKMGTSNVRRFEWPNGSTTTIYSHDQESTKLEGSNLHALFLDEPCPRSLWIAAFRGLRANKDYFVVLAGTPISEPWLYEELWIPFFVKKDPNICIVTGTTYENPHLSPDFVKDFESRLTPEERKVRIYGEFAMLQGRVFKDFSRPRHVFKQQGWPEEWNVWVALDPHPRKDHCVLYGGVTPEDEIVIFDELKISGTVNDLAEAMRKLEKDKHYRVVCRRIDNSGSAGDWNRNSMVAQLDQWTRENGYNVRVSPMRKSEKDVDASLNKIKLLLQKDQLRILDNCVNLVSDMELYSWQNFRHPEAAGVNEKPKKIHDDFIDCLRYLIMSNPIHSPTLSVISTLSDRNPYNKDTNQPSLMRRGAIINKDDF